jgi:hypothetical protein
VSAGRFDRLLPGTRVKTASLRRDDP